MGGYQGKTSTESSTDGSRDETVGAALTRPPSADTGPESSGRGENIFSRLGDWKSVRRTVNDLYQDNKHAFSFSPADRQTRDNYCDNSSENQHAVFINQRNSDGQTPLTSLIRNKDIDGVQELVKNPVVDLNYPEAQLYCGYRLDLYPPLIVAINDNNADIVELLLKSGASVNCKDSQGFSALYYASKLGNKDLVSLLIHHSADLIPTPQAFDDYTISDPLKIACCYGHLDTAEILIKAGCPVNPVLDTENNPPPLDQALDGDNEALCLLLLQNGAKINSKLFFKACQYGCEKVVQYMIDAGIDVRAVSEHGETALMFALNPGGISRLRRKLAYITDVETARKMAYGILQRNVNIIHILGKAGCDLDMEDRKDWMTVLHRSWQLQNMPAVIALLKHGASFQLNDFHYHAQYLSNHIYSILKDLYLLFVAPHIPCDILEKRAGEGYAALETDKVHLVTPLQHLCRLTIRSRLKSCRNNSSSIILGIEKMKLPPRLEEYLCFNEINEMSTEHCDTLFDLTWPINK